MPTYGYRCSRGHRFELVQRITDAPLAQCPQCQSPATRVFYPVGVIFRGQGFYKTDSRGSTSGSPGETATETPKTEPAAGAKEPPATGKGEKAGEKDGHVSAEEKKA